MEETPTVQAGQLVVGQLQLPQEGQADGESLCEDGDPVPAQVQLLQELQLGEAAVLHQADVVVLQQQDPQLAVAAEDVFGDDRDEVVGQVQEFGGGRDLDGKLGEVIMRAGGELKVSMANAASITRPVQKHAGRLGDQQEDEQEVPHDSREISETREMKL